MTTPLAAATPSSIRLIFRCRLMPLLLSAARSSAPAASKARHGACRERRYAAASCFSARYAMAMRHGYVAVDGGAHAPIRRCCRDVYFRVLSAMLYFARLSRRRMTRWRRRTRPRQRLRALCFAVGSAKDVMRDDGARATPARATHENACRVALRAMMLMRDAACRHAMLMSHATAPLMLYAAVSLFA